MFALLFLAFGFFFLFFVIIYLIVKFCESLTNDYNHNKVYSAEPGLGGGGHKPKKPKGN